MARQALQALDKILTAQSQRKRADVQESLAFMQFAMQKRASDIKTFGLQLDVLEKANTQAKINTANDFIQNSGLTNAMALVPTGIDDPDDREDALGDLSDKLKTKAYGGFHKQNANTIATALWTFRNTQDPTSIINLANQVSTTLSITPDKDTPDADINLIHSLKRIGNIQKLQETVISARKVKENEAKILKEKFEFAEGDTKIQSGFGMFGPEVQSEFEAQKPTDSKVMQAADNVDAYLKMQEKKDVAVDDEGVSTGDVLKVGGLTTAIIGGVTESQKQVAAKEFMERVAENTVRKIKNDASMMSAKEFRSMYNMSKKFAETPAGKKELMKQALEYGKSQTTMAKGLESVASKFRWAKDLNINWKSPTAISVGTFASPVVLPMIGEAIAGETGETVGEVASTGILINHVRKTKAVPAVARTFTNFLASKFPMIASKAGIAAMADSPAVPFGDIAALGIAAYDIIKYYKEWRELTGSEGSIMSDDEWKSLGKKSLTSLSPLSATQSLYNIVK